METLLSSHRTSLLSLFTTLSPQPNELLQSEFNQLELNLKAALEVQLSKAKSQVLEAETELELKWKCVNSWRSALGEKEGENRGNECLMILLKQVEGIIESMRDRMQVRGEAIVSLQARLQEFMTVLGKEWIKIGLDFVEGKGWEGIDLRLERMSELEREVVRCEEEIRNRREVIEFNINEIFAIRSELGINQASVDSVYSSEAANNPISDPFDEMILCHLGVGDAREQNEMAPTEENLLRVEAKRKWLEDEKNHRNVLIQSTYDKLHPLWTMLGVTDNEMEIFVEKYVGSTSDVVLAYQNELSRMLTLKRSNLASFILRERETLTNIWDSLYLSQAQRNAAFPPFNIAIEPTYIFNVVKGIDDVIVNENVSEELLVAHERETIKWEAEREACQDVLVKLNKYFETIQEMAELEASAADPSRLLGKSTRGDPGRLLREEKARKRVVKDKPKLEQKLRNVIPIWEKSNSRPFLFNGKRFIDFLDEKIQAEIDEKEAKKRAKAASQNRTVPLKPANTSGTTSGLRAQNTGQSNASSIKRQNTGQSTKSATSIRVNHTGGRALVPSTTGGRALTPSATGGRSLVATQTGGGKVLGEIGNRGNNVIGAGMKIPVGWEAEGEIEKVVVKPQQKLVAQITGFRPRAS